MSLHRKIVFAAALLAGSTALAQTAAPATGTNCAKLEPHPGRLASDTQRKQWTRDLQTWQECMRKYVTEAQSRAAKAVKEANDFVAESNAAVTDYNAAVKEAQAQIEANAN